MLSTDALAPSLLLVGRPRCPPLVALRAPLGQRGARRRRVAGRAAPAADDAAALPRRAARSRGHPGAARRVRDQCPGAVARALLDRRLGVPLAARPRPRLGRRRQAGGVEAPVALPGGALLLVEHPRHVARP